MKPVKIRWADLKAPKTHDLVGYVRGKLVLDVISSVDGWVIYHSSRPGPRDRWVHDGTQWVLGDIYNLLRGMSGAVTREEARLFAETLVR
jgi:hypothetical protein